MSVKACASVTASVQPTKPGARPDPATGGYNQPLKRLGALASMNKSLT
jgi:hypothetical protein